MSDTQWPDWALQLIRCPISEEPLHVASEELLNQLQERQRADQLFNRNGEPLTAEFDRGLVSRDNKYFYPAYDSIPALMASEAIEVDL